MSKVKDRYYKQLREFEEDFGKSDESVTNYVTELEQQNKEMLKLLIMEYRIAKAQPQDLTGMGFLRPVIECVTGKPIEEVLNENR